MKCIKCNYEINDNTVKCPFCGYDYKKNISNIKVICNSCGTYMNPETKICPQCCKKHALPASLGIGSSIILLLLIFILPVAIYFIVFLFGMGISSKMININDIVAIVKTIIYIIICIPLIIAILGYTGKILKNSEKKEKICLILSIISIVGLIGFYTFTKNSKIQFDDYDKQEYITLNNISVPTLYKITNYDNTFMAMRLKEIDDNFEAEVITIQTNETIPVDILTSYKNVLLKNGYNYLGVLDEENDGYIYYENNYYMLIVFSENNKSMVYLSFDQQNYEKFLQDITIIKE